MSLNAYISEAEDEWFNMTLAEKITTLGVEDEVNDFLDGHLIKERWIENRALALQADEGHHV